jgi:hypothetical protein
VNAWGSENGDSIEPFLWDLLAESAPEKLFIFAAGNNGKVGEMRITDQGGAKNVLTVGALDIRNAQELESSEKREYEIIANGMRYSASLWAGGADLFLSTVIIENASVSQTAESGKVLYARTSVDLCGILPLAAIVGFDPQPCPDIVSFPVLCVNADLSGITSVTVEFTAEQTNSTLMVAEWSSAGPGNGGILKPEIVAPGSAVVSAARITQEETVCSNITGSLTTLSGTSLAAAEVGGAALLIQQYFADGYYPTGIAELANSVKVGGNLLRAMLVASADPLSQDGTRYPSMESGHGSVNLANILPFNRGIKIIQDFSIKSDEHFSWQVLVNELSRPLRIAMAYFDTAIESEWPGVLSDLDLFIESPNHSVVYGNMRPNTREERFSTIEKILLFPEELQLGQYTIHIVAHHLSSASVQFSLVVVGPLDSTHPFEKTNETLSQCQKGEVGLHCQIKCINIKEAEQQILLPPLSVEYFQLNIPLNAHQNIYITFSHQESGTFQVLAEVDAQPTTLRQYAQHWKYTGLTSSLLVSAEIAPRISYVGLALVNLGPSPSLITAVMTLEQVRVPSESDLPSIPQDYYLPMVVGYILVAMLLPIVIVLAFCLWVSRRNSRHSSAFIS